MTAGFDYSVGTPPLAEAIDHHPLIVAPDVCLLNVVNLMNQTAQTHLADSLHGARASCVLVMQGEALQGIFTERDLVQLTACGIDLQTTKISEVMHHPVITISEQALYDVFAALFLFRRHRIRHLAILNDQQHLVGVVSIESIRHVLRPTNLLRIRRVAEVMTKQVIVAWPQTSVIELTELMAKHQVSCIVIAEPGPDETSQHPIGIVTERDIVRFHAIGLDVGQTPAEAVMSTPLFLLSPEDSLWTAHQAMEQHQVRRLVVSWNWGQNLGIVTQTSILRVFDPVEMHGVIETLQRTLQQLGLNLEQVLASAIDHDTHLPAPACSIQAAGPDLKQLLGNLQSQITHLVQHPEITSDLRQATLALALADLQTLQSLL